ncbi:PilW family protein [Sulfuricystis multivorans]|uniref:PilW family protein n=1 Tax=Sulfuricystis multivorans TaxID=2211108 RepID=UPI000F8336DB|nr:PilW family protein [Sulfuricystis multivorans]
MHFTSLSTSRGFSLIELLVALVIAMIGTIAIMQVYIRGESGKRALGSLGEAQSGAIVALYQIEREMQRAGYGFLDRQVLGCRIRSNLASGLNNRYLQPVSIVPAGATASHLANLWGIPPGDPGSDMLVIVAGDGASIIEGSRLATPAAAGDTVLHLVNKNGIHSNPPDFLLVGESGSDCTLTRASGTINPPNVDDEVAIDFATVAAYGADNAIVMHLGGNPTFVVYAVRNGMLTRCDFTVSNCADSTKINDLTVWQPIANDVVALVAQYGVDTTAPNRDRVIDLFCKTRVPPGGTCPASDTGLTDAPGSDASQTVRAEDGARILAVRIAVVTRSGQAEKDPVSPATLKLWADNTNAADGPLTQGPVWSVPDQHYRYRVANSIVVLRNLLWSGV